jgi:hypothetical protein
MGSNAAHILSIGHHEPVVAEPNRDYLWTWERRFNWESTDPFRPDSRGYRVRADVFGHCGALGFAMVVDATVSPVQEGTLSQLRLRHPGDTGEVSGVRHGHPGDRLKPSGVRLKVSGVRPEPPGVRRKTSRSRGKGSGGREKPPGVRQKGFGRRPDIFRRSPRTLRRSPGSSKRTPETLRPALLRWKRTS